jgi:hypothetical protein
MIGWPVDGKSHDTIGLRGTDMSCMQSAADAWWMIVYHVPRLPNGRENVRPVIAGLAFVGSSWPYLNTANGRESHGDLCGPRLRHHSSSLAMDLGAGGNKVTPLNSVASTDNCAAKIV